MTAVEWMADKVDNLIPFISDNTSKKFCELVEQAKEIEKEQIIYAYAQALANERDCDLGMRELCSAHTYYEKKYIK